jgi:hypothetical protein
MSFISFCIAHVFFKVIALESVVMEQYGDLFCGWMDGMFANIQCRGLAYAVDVYVILILRV